MGRLGQPFDDNRACGCAAATRPAAFLPRRLRAFPARLAYPWPVTLSLPRPKVDETGAVSQHLRPVAHTRLARLCGALLLVAGLGAAWSSTALAAPGVSVSEATAEQKKQALTLYEEGGKLFQAGKFNEALIAFNASYEIVRSPNAHLMLARSLIELGRFPAAAQELVGAEAEASSDPRYAATLEKVRTLKTELAPKIGTLRVEVKGHPEPDRLVLVVSGNSGAPACKLNTPCLVTAEALKLTVLEGAETKASQEVTIVGGDDKTITLDLTPPPALPPPTLPPPKPRPAPVSDDSTAYFIAGGVIAAVGLGGIGAGGALFAMAQSDMDELEATCGADKLCPASAQDLIDGGSSKQTWSIVAFIAGGATTGLGVGLLIAGGAKRGGASTGEQAHTAPRTELLVAPAFLGLKSSF